MWFYSKLNLALFIVLGILSGCNKYQPERQRPVANHKVKVRFEASSNDAYLKSTVSGKDNYINDVIIFAYNDLGMLVGELSFSGGAAGYMSLMSGMTYNIYALANVPGFSAPKRESEIFSMRYSIKSISELEKSGFPMVAQAQITVTESNMKVNLNMSRLVSRISFSKESFLLPGFRVTSVRLINAPLDVLCFCEQSAATTSAVGDYATAEDLRVINSGGSADFYMFENCQGVLLPDNTDPRKKVPDNLSPSKASLCTYFEVTAVLDGTSGMSGPVTYRFYLGQDLVSDFNIFRNTHNKVTLVATSGGLEEVSWRMDSEKLIPMPVPVVAVGSRGMICYTDANGVVKKHTVGTDDWNDVIFAGGKYVAVGDNGTVAVSDDASVWNLKIVGTADWQSVAYGNGRFIVAGYYDRPVIGSQYARRTFACVARSTDTGRWTVTEEPDHVWYDVVYGNGSFLITGSYSMWDSSNRTWVTMKSADGVSWAKNSNGSRYFPCLLAGDNEFVALTAGTYSYSSDGYNWSSPSYGGFSNIDKLAWDGKRKYVAVGRLGNVVYSSDCRSWSASTVPFTENWRKVTYGKERFVTVGVGGAVIYSSDGRMWYKLDLGITNSLYGVCIMN